MTLLGQEKRFAALDFCYHLLNVHQVDNQDGAVQGYVSLFIPLLYPYHLFYIVSLFNFSTYINVK